MSQTKTWRLKEANQVQLYCYFLMTAHTIQVQLEVYTSNMGAKKLAEGVEPPYKESVTIRRQQPQTRHPAVGLDLCEPSCWQTPVMSFILTGT